VHHRYVGTRRRRLPRPGLGSRGGCLDQVRQDKGEDPRALALDREHEAKIQAAALVALLAGLATAVLLALDPLTGLGDGLDPSNLVAATIATGALALCYSSVAFAVGAATGNRSLALSVGSVVASSGSRSTASPRRSRCSVRCATSPPDTGSLTATRSGGAGRSTSGARPAWSAWP
jgi:type IV secretory pathway VirB6-like protein